MPRPPVLLPPKTSAYGWAAPWNSVVSPTQTGLRIVRIGALHPDTLAVLELDQSPGSLGSKPQSCSPAQRLSTRQCPTHVRKDSCGCVIFFVNSSLFRQSLFRCTSIMQAPRVQEPQTRLVNARFHFIWECVKKEKLLVLHVPTRDMLADMLTKPLPRVPLESHCLAIGVV
jgi:hypothetical protein